MSRYLGPDERQVLDAIFDSARSTHTVGGRLDHVAAALQVMDEVEALAAAGHVWAATYSDARRLAGFREELKNRTKRRVVSVAIPAIGTTTMPAAYSQRTPDGTHQLSLWLFTPVEEVEKIAAALQRQGETLSERGLVMRLGIEFARKHGVATPAEGFTAEGINLGEVAA